MTVVLSQAAVLRRLERLCREMTSEGSKQPFTYGYHLKDAEEMAIKAGYDVSSMVGFAIGSARKKGKTSPVGLIHCFVETNEGIKNMWRDWMTTLNFHVTWRHQCHMYGDIDATGWTDSNAIADWIETKLLPAVILFARQKKWLPEGGGMPSFFLSSKHRANKTSFHFIVTGIHFASIWPQKVFWREFGAASKHAGLLADTVRFYGGEEKAQ